MSTVRIEDDGQVRTITLNRPERRNALVPEMQDELIVAFTDANTCGARVVILAAEGESFCSGLDLAVLREMGSMSHEQHRVEAERVAGMFRALWEIDVPTIALVQGAAVAGGAGLATICDFTIATANARFGYTEARIGFVPAVVSAYLTLQVGDKAARGLMLSARIIGGDEALKLGLVSEIVENLPERAMTLTAELVRNSPASLRATKQLLRSQRAEWLDAALALAMLANTASRETADFKEGVASFTEKRKPVWI